MINTRRLGFGLIGGLMIGGFLFLTTNGIYDCVKHIKYYQNNPIVQERKRLSSLVEYPRNYNDYERAKEEYSKYISNPEIKRELEKAEKYKIPAWSGIALVLSIGAFMHGVPIRPLVKAINNE